MTAIHGALVVIKLGDGGDPEQFNALAGLKSKKLSVNNEAIDVTTQDSVDLWREYLARGGPKSVSLAGDGVFAAGVQQGTLLGIAMSGTDIVRSYQLVLPGFGTFEGPFLLESYEMNADTTDATQFSLTLNSAGQVTFTAE